jgi:hypothetical protein
VAYSFCTIEGLPIALLVGSGAEEPPEVMGRQRRAFAGNLLSTERSPKLAFSGQADFWSAAELDLFLQAISLPTDPAGTIPKLVTVSSDPDGLTRGRTITAVVRAGKREAMVQTVAGAETTFWTVPLSIRQA